MRLKDFLDSSYTAYHATANACEILKEEGFVQLTLGDGWQLERGGSYFVTRNGSSVVAFCLGQSNVFNVAVSHTDSPSFKIKGDRLIENEGLKRLNTEKYGGGLLYSYFDRQMKVAGRLLTETADGVEPILAVSDYNVVIPSLAIHLNRESNEKPLLNVQKDLLPLFAQGEAQLYASLTDRRVLDADLYVVPASDAFECGVHNEFLCSARLDNLTNVYNSLYALVDAEPQDIAVVACLDNEETGSGTRQGAPSFLRQVLDGIVSALELTPTERVYASENGMVLSVDNGHAAHPAHAEKHDPQYRCRMNGGVIVKHHVNYATDGLSAAVFKRLMEDVSLPYQDLYNNSELSGGSTLGLITARELGMKVCDIGIAQLAMHSACETCGTEDLDTMRKALTAFLSCTLAGVDSVTVK